MKSLTTGALLVAGIALATPAMAASGQCSMTGLGQFACDVSVDGGGIVFALPDGRTLVFSHQGNGEGNGYLMPETAQPGRAPVDLGHFAPDTGKAGCWVGEKDGTKFCVAVQQ